MEPKQKWRGSLYLHLIFLLYKSSIHDLIAFQMRLDRILTSTVILSFNISTIHHQDHGRVHLSDILCVLPLDININFKMYNHISSSVFYFQIALVYYTVHTSRYINSRNISAKDSLPPTGEKKWRNLIRCTLYHIYQKKWSSSCYWSILRVPINPNYFTLETKISDCK